ncbi:MAG: SOS response-associated peptidase [Chitinophagaceae bacterium]|nr:SOS response-associated peptidase [Chitinophagaceae bacterium]
MCGRYSFFTPIPQAEMGLGVKAVEWAEWQARYNAAPTQVMPVITNEFPGIIQFFRWGLVPKWASDISIGQKMINTRTESIIEKPAFRNIFKYKRCLVLADGYYEWMPLPAVPGSKTRAAKQPYRFHLPHNEVMLLAGLWDTWQGTLNTFSIITCPANRDVEHIHNRMPVVLSHPEAKLWLSNEVPADQLLPLLKPAPEGVLQFYPISTNVNKPIVDDPSIVEPLTA